MSAPEPSRNDGPRPGLSRNAIIGLIALAFVLIVGGLCVFLVLAGG